MQMTLVGTVRVRIVRPYGEKDYAFLNVEQIVYISLVIDTFKFFLYYFFSHKYF